MATQLSDFATAVQTLVSGGQGYTAYTYETLAHGSTDTPIADLGGSGPYTIYTDCSGWVNFALDSVDPIAQAVAATERTIATFNPGSVNAYGGSLVIDEATQPWARADVLSYLFQHLGTVGDGVNNGFTQVSDFSTVQAGDIIAYATGIYADPLNKDAASIPSLGVTNDTGHTMVVVTAPEAVPEADWGLTGSATPPAGLANDGLSSDAVAVYAVGVVDSSDIAHFTSFGSFNGLTGFTEPLADSRSYAPVSADPPNLPSGVPQNQLQVGGLGAGTIWFAVNAQGTPIQFRFDLGDPWFPNDSGASGAADAVSIAVARPSSTIDLTGNILDANNHLVVDLFSDNAPDLGGVSYTQAETITGTGGLWVTGGGSMTLGGGNSFSGGLSLDGAAVELAGAGAAGTGTTGFIDGTVSTLKVDSQGALPTTGVFNVAYQDRIDLAYLGYQVGSHAELAGGRLVVTSGLAKTQFDLTTTSLSTVSGFTTTADATGGTIVTVACFAAGTLIETEAGEVAVESLRPGDRVITLFTPAPVPVRWIGHRRIDIAGHARPASVRPVRIRAGALGAGLPRHDVTLSPEHAVFVDGVLIPAAHLVNGRDIVTLDVAEVTYFHLLLDRHDVVRASGLPCETLLDISAPALFQNAGEAPESLAFLSPCAPRVTQGEILERVRRRIDARCIPA